MLIVMPIGVGSHLVKHHGADAAAVQNAGA
jgi:hypothetical protein